MSLLQASEPPPRPGELTVGEVECRFLVREEGDEPQFAALPVSSSHVHGMLNSCVLL